MGCSVALGARWSSGMVWVSLDRTGSLWPFSVITTPCPSSAGFSHTMEQSAQASPVPIAHGPTEGFCPAFAAYPQNQSKGTGAVLPQGFRLRVRENQQHGGLQAALLGGSELGAPQSEGLL